jgi:gamma-glutamyltranspeptidase/glutathione hydrolase
MPRQTFAKTAAVATGHPLGAAAGLEMLEGGGNAADAAVAAMLAMCVVVPGSVGLGGYGGSAVVYDGRSRRVVAVDFDSRAPLAFREGLVTADRESNYYGARAVTVPAVVAGLDLIRREFGSKSWAEVLRPAIRLADEGFEFDREHERQFAKCAPKFDQQSIESLFQNGETPEAGKDWRQPDLARLLRTLADDGPAAFYEGPIAATIVQFLRKRGGILSEDDFHAYSPQITDPLQAKLQGVQLYTPPPPSGGITSLSIVQTMERLGVSDMDLRGPPYYHALAEAMKMCWMERHSMLGDPDFVRLDPAWLLSAATSESRAEKIREGQVAHNKSAANPSPHTANVIAIDGVGNLVSLTATQGWMYGSHLVVEGLGLVLNHGMSRFDYLPGHPNSPAPGKRMQHNMAPMVALRDGKPAFAYGLPGGPKIVNVTAQLALETIIFGTSPTDAIKAPRVHTDGNEPLLASHHLPSNVVAELERIGHSIQHEVDMGGPVNVLAVNPQTNEIDIASGETTGDVAGF